MNEDYYLMWLLSIEGLGRKKANALIELFGSIENVWNLSKKDLAIANFIPEKVMQRLTSSRKYDVIEKLIRTVEENNMGYISIFKDNYPELLKHIDDAPLGLYIKGEMPGANSVNISVVGSRDCSEYGLTAAYKFSRELAENGVVIVSGMARGVDSMAHKGALEGHGKTIAVLGSGLDVCYPQENFTLMQEIIENGCVISEYPPGTKPFRGNFPARNRIISGLSKGLLVVEAAQRSGTSITVDQALEQGREVFSVPGSVFSRVSVGANKLIKDGAHMVQTYEDILEGLGIDTAFILKDSKENGNTFRKSEPSLEGEEKIIYDNLSIEPVSIDEMVLKTDMNMQKVQLRLIEMELSGYVRRLPGQRYIKRL